jgi:hypothetical protein
LEVEELTAENERTTKALRSIRSILFDACADTGRAMWRSIERQSAAGLGDESALSPTPEPDEVMSALDQIRAGGDSPTQNENAPT